MGRARKQVERQMDLPLPIGLSISSEHSEEQKSHGSVRPTESCFAHEEIPQEKYLGHILSAD